MTKTSIQQRFLTTKTIGCLSEAVCDLQIVCRDGVLRTHQAILSWSSGFLRRLCSSHFILEDGGKKKEDLMIYLNDYTVEVVTAFLNFMYNGELSTFASAEFIEDFKQLWEDVRVDKISYSKAYEDGRINVTTNESVGKSFPEKQSVVKTKKNVEKPILPSVPQRPKASPPFTPARPFSKPNLKLKSPRESLQKSKIKIPQSTTTTDTALNQRLLMNTMKKASLVPKPLPKLLPKLIPKTPENISSNINSLLEKPAASSEGDDDAVLIVDEVKATNSIPMVIKRELPPGISITKQVSMEERKDCEKFSQANVDVDKSSSEARVEKDVPPVENSQRKVAEINPTQAVAVPGPKAQGSIDLRRPSPRTPNVSEPPRKMSRRSAANVVSTYNLDKIAEAVFEKPQQGPLLDLSKSHQEEIVAKTKNLRIPLTKLSVAEGKTDNSRESPPQPKSIVLTPRAVKTPFKVSSPKLTKTPFKKSPKKVISEVSAVRPGPEMAAITCYICKNNRDAKGGTLCLKNLSSLRQHVSMCLYEAGKLAATIPESEAGTVYSCEVEGCWLGGRSGYKEYAIHKASQHGAMELVLSEDGPEAEKLMESIMEYEGSKMTPSVVKSEDISNVTLDEVSVPVVKEKQTIIAKSNPNPIQSKPDSALLKCRFQTCSASFKSNSKREIKLHYASQHFSDCFVTNPNTGVPDNFLKLGNRTVCQVCSNNSSNKPVYIQSEKEAIRGHLVVKHDIMAKLLSEVSGHNATEAKLAFQDIYQTP